VFGRDANGIGGGVPPAPSFVEVVSGLLTGMGGASSVCLFMPNDNADFLGAGASIGGGRFRLISSGACEDSGLLGIGGGSFLFSGRAGDSSSLLGSADTFIGTGCFSQL